MADLVTSFRDFVAREQLFSKADKLLLACSGGLDSTVLAHLLHAEGYDFAIAHMNFQLRGEASDGDAAFVEELARTLDAEFYCEAVDVKAQALPGESTQMTARRVRYSFFNKLRDDINGRCVLTAHHQDDNFETSLINLIRGTGLAGLKGMQPYAWSIARPLLTSSREAIEAFAVKHQILWREDASNATDAYLRNRIRHKLTPYLEENFALTATSWQSTSDNLKSDYRLQQAGLRLLREKYTNTRYGPTEIKRVDWALADLPAYPDLVYQIAKEYDFNAEQVRQLLSFTGQSYLESSSSRAYLTPKYLAFERLVIIGRTLPPVTINDLPFYRPDVGCFNLRLETVTKPAELDAAKTLYLAPQTLPLHLRPRQNGDRFQPLGMGGKTKKVKDYMIDQKIPVWLRDRIYLLTNAEGEIMAIPGYCISEKFKVLPHHSEVLKVSAS